MQHCILSVCLKETEAVTRRDARTGMISAAGDHKSRRGERLGCEGLACMQLTCPPPFILALRMFTKPGIATEHP